MSFWNVLPWGGVRQHHRLQKGLDKFGEHIHKQAAKGVGKGVASSIPNPSPVGAGNRREYPAEDGLMLSQAHVQ